MSTMESFEMEELREQLRLEKQKNEKLARENTNLKKTRPPEKASIARATFVLNDIDLLDDNSTDAIEICGVKVTMHTEQMTDNNGANKIYLWFEFDSPSRHNATLSCRIQAHSTFQDIQFVKLSEGITTLSTPVMLRGYKIDYRSRLNQGVNITVDMKFIKEAREDTNDFNSDEKFAEVKVGDKIFKVNVSYISAWSEFFPRYFGSEMKESKEEVFGIDGFTEEQFQEMLDVIYPASKPIDRWNVLYLIQMADRFMMPSLTWKCEMFLAETSKHTLSDLELLQFADAFSLVFTQNIVLDRATAERLQKVVSSDEYKKLSADMKRDINDRYVDLVSAAPREQPPRRNNRQNNRQRDDEMSRDDDHPRYDYDGRLISRGSDFWQDDQ